MDAEAGGAGDGEAREKTATKKGAKARMKAGSVAATALAETESAEDRARRQAERQRAYRERQKTRGVVELRVQIPQKYEDSARNLIDRLVNNDPILKLAARRGHRLALLLPGIGILGALLLGAAVIGGVFTGIGLNLLHADSLRANRERVAILEEELAAVTHERDQYAGRISSLLSGETRDRRDLASLQKSLRELSSRIGAFESPEQALGDRERRPTPPGPRLVPETQSRSGTSATTATPSGRTPEAQAIVYRLKDGDTLRDVADSFGVSVDAMKELNAALRPSPWRYGDLLVVPVGSSRTGNEPVRR